MNSKQPIIKLHIPSSEQEEVHWMEVVEEQSPQRNSDQNQSPSVKLSQSLEDTKRKEQVPMDMFCTIQSGRQLTAREQKIKKMLTPLFRERFMTKLSKLIEARLEAKRITRRFAAKYPISFKNVNLEIERSFAFRWAIDPLENPRTFRTQFQPRLNTDQLRMVDSELEREVCRLRVGIGISLAQMHQILRAYLETSDGYLDVYHASFDGIVNFSIYSDYIEALTKVYSIAKVRRRLSALSVGAEKTRYLSDITTEVS